MSNQPWTDADNERRCDLIDADVLGMITRDDYWELRALNNRLHRHKAEVAPIKEVTATLKALKESAVEQERADFHAWMQETHPGVSFSRHYSGKYRSGVTQAMWAGWLARAKLDRGDLPKLMELPEPTSDPSPPHPEHPPAS